MVDSGNQISNGYVSFYNVYKAMVDAALARAAQAEIQAYYWRVGDKVRFYVQVKNLSAVTLSSTGNSATLHGIVYEEAQVKVTHQFARAAVETSISSLAPNGTATFQFETSDLAGVDWDKLHAVVAVDYRPAGSTGAFDMLQAAVATRLDAPFSAEPKTVTFFVAPADSSVPPVAVSLQGPAFVNWVASTSASWFTVTPASGPATAQVTVSVLKDRLVPGWQHGTITFATGDGLFSTEVSVRAYLGSILRVHLPVMVRTLE